MLQLRSALVRHQRARLAEQGVTTIRQFSITQSHAKDAGQPGANVPRNRSNSPSHAPSRKNSIPPTNLNARKPDFDQHRPRRIFDARSLAAPSSNGQSANILRSTLVRNPRKGPPVRTRRSRPSAKSSLSKTRKAGRPRRARNTDMEEGDDEQQTQIENVYRELLERRKPTASRYTPQAPDYSNLMETWPSLPTNGVAGTAEVIGKLSSLSDRYPNDYVPPYELGARLFKGQFVQFLNEEEKLQAISEAKKLSQQRADEYSQRRGDLAEPKDVIFTPLCAEDQKSLIQAFIQGAYPKLNTEQAVKSPISEVTKNLRNNESYQAVGKSSQFIAKVESLLASGRPVKRA